MTVATGKGALQKSKIEVNTHSNEIRNRTRPGILPLSIAFSLCWNLAMGVRSGPKATELGGSTVALLGESPLDVHEKQTKIIMMNPDEL